MSRHLLISKTVTMVAKQDMKFVMLMPWAAIILLFSCGAGTINCMTLNGNDTDFVSLLDFKRAIINDPKRALSSWNTTTHFCSWEGVVCSQTRPERVEKLNLSGQALDGHISPSLGNMSYLIYLDLSRNMFSGYIPPHLGYLHKVKLLDLGKNSLQGNIPDAVTNCSSLLGLYLDRNLLTGEIPKKLVLLSKLLDLWLQSNNLSGVIPPNIGNITTLEYIFLNSNQFHGSIPEELGKLSNMSNLSLGANMLSGRIPEALFNLSLLQQLAMPVNLLHGPLPSNIGDFLPNLQYLLLGTNMLGDHVPDSLGNASELQLIDLGYNFGFTGKIPPSLGKLQKLRTLYLFHNNLKAEDSQGWEFLDALTNCTLLERLRLDGNQLQGVLPNSVGNLSSNLEYLMLGSNMLYASVPSSLGNLHKVTLLDLSLNSFTGPIDGWIGNMVNLEGLFLHRNTFSGHIPYSIGNFSKLSQLFLTANQFQGPIPSSLGKLQQLSILDLGYNNLQGNIPKDLIAATVVQCSLSHNNLEGQIPYVGNLLQLSSLDLSSNKLTGEIPPSLGTCKQLQTVIMDSNFLSGSIPAFFGQLGSLTMLNLSYNNFSGSIPISLSKLQLLAQLDLSHNHLDGKVPTEGVFKNTTAVSLEGNWGLCGGVLDLHSLGKLQQLSILDLGYNNLQGNIPKDLIAATVVQCSLSHNNLEGQIPYVGNLLQLSSLDLSSNKLTGEIPPSLGTCKQLQTVIMDSNFLSGSIPAFFGQLGSLTMLNLSYNNFSGSIPISLSKLQLLAQLDLSHNHLDGKVPTEGVFKNTTAVSLEGNWGLCGGVLDLHMPPCPNPTQKIIGWRHYFLRIAIPIIGIVSITLLIYFIISRKKVPRTRLPPSFSGEQFPNVSYKDLAQATENFAESNLLGRGSHGSVYKGRLITPEPMVVAVKVFNLDMEGTDRSFISECQALRNIRHRNLIPILTACSTIDNMGNDFKGLVYRFMPNGSLDTWLHSPGHGNLDLSQRLKIIVDVADALQYIHHDCETSIIHCDLKPSNILLDDDMAAHLADFGVARFYLETRSQTVGDSKSTGTINLKGTIGYIAPEYAGGTYLSTCGDVYSFGVVLVEMLTGKRPTDPLFCNGLNIISFCKTSFPDQILDIVDTHLLEEHQECARVANPEDENRVLRCLVALVKVALSCTCEAPADRMNMREAAAELHNIKMAHW